MLPLILAMAITNHSNLSGFELSRRVRVFDKAEARTTAHQNGTWILKIAELGVTETFETQTVASCPRTLAVYSPTLGADSLATAWAPGSVLIYFMKHGETFLDLVLAADGKDLYRGVATNYETGAEYEATLTYQSADRKFQIDPVAVTMNATPHVSVFGEKKFFFVRTPGEASAARIRHEGASMSLMCAGSDSFGMVNDEATPIVVGVFTGHTADGPAASGLTIANATVRSPWKGIRSMTATLPPYGDNEGYTVNMDYVFTE